jgi:hypothetical protein
LVAQPARETIKIQINTATKDLRAIAFASFVGKAE